jgi:glyoxylase-like metal-dependent hydrolase (beta-lactamase superfamily II)
MDAGWQDSGETIGAAAELLFGVSKRPFAILLTHIHPDHSGALPELAHHWQVPVYIHSDEMPFATGKLIAEYFNPLDRWLIAPLMKVIPKRIRESNQTAERLTEVVKALDQGRRVPGLPDWQYIPTPGHTPGHIAFFRKSDGVLIAGDALLTVNINNLWDFLLNKQRVSGPPYISTWNWAVSKKSVAVLASLEPQVLACGHGIPMIGPQAAQELQKFSESFTR